jgi:hypothetical protein
MLRVLRDVHDALSVLCDVNVVVQDQPVVLTFLDQLLRLPRGQFQLVVADLFREVVAGDEQRRPPLVGRPEPSPTGGADDPERLAVRNAPHLFGLSVRDRNPPQRVVRD